MGQTKLFSLIGRAVFDYKLIEEGDRIPIGVSGGKGAAVWSCRT